MIGLATFDQMAGGSARHLSGLAAAMRRLGHEVHLMTSASFVGAPGHSQKGLLGQLARAAVRIFVVIPGGALIVLRHRPAVVNIHFALDGVGAVLCARALHIPVVVMFQGPWALEAIATGRRGDLRMSTWARRALERFVYQGATRCIVLSEAFRNVLISEYGVAPELVDVIPGAIDVERFPPTVPADCRARLGYPEQPTVITLRRLVPRMGLDLAIEALARMSPALRPRFVIGGSGPERPRLEALAHRLGVASHVTFAGRLPDEQLPTFYGAGEVCVVPSRELEGFGYVALESLAAGTPVVAAATGGLVELVGGLEPRWLVPAEPAALAERIADVLLRPEMFPSRDECRAYARQFNWSEIAGRTATVFQRAAEQA